MRGPTLKAACKKKDLSFYRQKLTAADGAQGMTDEQIDHLKRGGHDLVKIPALPSYSISTSFVNAKVRRRAVKTYA